jgi:tetratricopeptide (TPR) repeat protein
MGVYHLSTREYNQALQKYATADRLRPNYVDVASGIGGVYWSQGRWQDAAAEYHRALELDPHDYVSLYSLADTLKRLKRYREAAGVVDRAIAVAPDRPTAYAMKHWIYHAWHGPSQQARRVLEEVPAGIPGLEENWFLQELYQRNYEAALEHLSSFPEPVIRRFYRLLPVPLGECWCYSLMNQPDRARESGEAALVVLEEALRERPDDPAVHISLALAYAYLGAKEMAINHADRALELRPVSEDAWIGVQLLYDSAWVFAQVGELDRAIDQLEYLLSNPTGISIAMLCRHPELDPLRDHPRFQEILEKYGEEH